MKSYVIDELRPPDCEKLRSYLDDNFGPPAMGGVYWIPIKPQLLSVDQSAHGKCQPFYFAIELDSTKLAGELLVRTKDRIRCTCIKYATDDQQNWLIHLIDEMLAQLDIAC